MEFGMEEWWNNRNGDVELFSSFPTQFESPKTESGCKSYGQNGAEAEISFSVRTVGGGHSGWRRADTPVWPDIPVCFRRRLRWQVPGRQEHARDAILAEKLDPKLKIGGEKDGIRLWERKGSKIN